MKNSWEHRNCFNKDLNSLRAEKVLAGWNVAEHNDTSFLRHTSIAPYEKRAASLSSVLRITSNSSISLHTIGNADAKWTWRALGAGLFTGSCGSAEYWASVLSGLKELTRTLKQYLIKSGREDGIIASEMNRFRIPFGT